ncbi:MAG: hypothetical protein U5N26_04630 [Candidatus Marinimicrobia bacterium]|nr:hypothetical protein [Candidatus Neomarinimicrobiota bacterium]
MKKNLLTLLLLISSFSLMGAVDINYKLTNSMVTYSGTGEDRLTYYEFDLVAWVGNTEPLILYNGMLYIEYNSETFGERIVSNNKIDIQKQGPLADDDRNYSIINTADNKFNVFALTFAVPDGTDKSDLDSYYQNSYITNNSTLSEPIFHVKMEVLPTLGPTNVKWSKDYSTHYDPSDQTYFTITETEATMTEFEGLITSNTTYDDVIFLDGSGDPALPVVLADFRAEYEDGAVDLEWITESETQNSGFVLKRAVVDGDDALEYTVISSYLDNAELLGAGTTTEQHIYDYRDSDVKPGVTYS